MNTLLALNLHKHADAAPAFCIVDAVLRDEIQQSRWLTLDSRVFRSRYDSELMAQRPESLARFIFMLHGVEAPKWLKHVNTDLLDLRMENLASIDSPGMARRTRTGEGVRDLLQELGHTPSSARLALGFSIEGVENKRGRKPKN